MKRLASFAFACLAFFCLMVATERRALAFYVDPGSGFLALQSAASVLATVGYFFRRRLFGFFRKPEMPPTTYVAAATNKDRDRKVA
jgi:hypothetical protein